MGEYKNCLEKIKEYLLKRDIKNSEEWISLYYLSSVLNEKFALLRDEVGVDNLVKRINSRDILFLFSKVVPFLNEEKYANCRFINVYTKDKVAVMDFSFHHHGSKFSDLLEICKNFDQDELYIGGDYWKHSLEVVPYQREILEKLSLVEEYAKILKMNIRNYRSDALLVAQYSDFVFDIRLLIDSYGNVIKNVSFVDSDIENVAKRKWLNQQSLNEVVKSCEGEILKKIPVSVSSLDPSFQDIVLSSFHKKLVLSKKIKSC